MKDFCVIILLVYFGYKLFMGFIVVYNWNSPTMLEVRKEDDNVDNINIYYTGMMENLILMAVSFLLYSS